MIPLLRRRDRRQRRAAHASLPDTIEVVVIGVRAGLTPSAAFTMAIDHAPPELRVGLEPVVHRMHRGHRLADALDAIPEWLGEPASFFTDALVTADRYGLPLGPMLDQLGADVRAARARLAQQRARTLPVKLSFPLVVCTLPSFVLLAIVPAVLGAVSTLRGTAP
ncbi:MAG: type II secretion system F family protein [Ilumatobacter sp.]|nr:type II secretion system F family protein [Ilumatobacter sp.]